MLDPKQNWWRWLALQSLRVQLVQVRRAATLRQAIEHAAWACYVARRRFREKDQRGEFLAFYWASYSRLIDRGDSPDSAFSSAIQNARRSVLRGSKFLESEYCGSAGDELRSPRRPKIQPCACGWSMDVHRDCRNCGTRARGSLGNPGACYVDCLDPLPLRQLADRTDGGPSRELWSDRGGETVDDPADVVRELLSIR